MSRVAVMGKRPSTWLLQGLLAIAFAMSSAAMAHGLLVSVRGDQNAISGRVYYANGDPGNGEWVQLFDLTEPALPPLGINAAQDGSFRFAGVEGHRYRVSVTGEEDHAVDSEITLGTDARGRFVERKQDSSTTVTATAWWPPPAWAVIGGVLVLSMIPAVWLRLRKRSPGQRAP